MKERRWNETNVRLVVLDCESKTEFQLKYSGAVKYARRHGFYDEITKDLEKFRWTYDSLIEFVKSCEYKKKFHEKSGAFVFAKKHGYIDECNALLKGNALWCHDSVKKIALKYQKKTHFFREAPGAHDYAIRHKIYDEVTSHMDVRHHWSYGEVKNLALKCETRWEFQKKYRGAYRHADRFGLLDDVGKHFRVVGNKSKRKIYEIRFHNIKKIYIGLSFDPTTRKKSHMVKSSNRFVKDLMEKNEEFEWFEDDTFYSENKIGEVENKRISERKSEGWEILNINKGGALGGFKKDKIKSNWSRKNIKR
jgi:hypothetical protein